MCPPGEWSCRHWHSQGPLVHHPLEVQVQRTCLRFPEPILLWAIPNACSWPTAVSLLGGGRLAQGGTSLCFRPLFTVRVLEVARFRCSYPDREAR